MMTISFGILVSSGVGEDGITGAKAFEDASNIASETLSAMRTVISFSGEVKAAERFESKLKQVHNYKLKAFIYQRIICNSHN